MRGASRVRVAGESTYPGRSTRPAPRAWPAVASICLLFGPAYLAAPALTLRPAAWGACAGAVLLLGALLTRCRARRAFGADLAIGAAVVALGLGWGGTRPRDPNPPPGLPAMVLRGVVRETLQGRVADGISFAWGGRWHPVRGRYRAPVAEASGPFLARGYLIRLDEPRMPGLADPYRGARWAGLAGRMQLAERWAAGGGGEDRHASWREAARRALDRRVGRSVPPSIRALIAMTVWGEAGTLDADLQRMFRSTGTMHLVANSGLHVTLIAVGCEFLLRLLVRRRAARVGVVLAAILGYVGLVGPVPSILRAAVMAACLVVGRASGRPGGTAAAWWASLLLVICLTPGEIPSLGFQLSYGATGALLVRPRVTRRLEPLNASFAASLSTTGIFWSHFGEAPMLSTFANLIGIPLFTPAFFAILWGLVWGDPANATLQALAWGPARSLVACWLAPLVRMTPAAEATIARISSGEACGVIGSLAFIAALAAGRKLARARGAAAAAAAALGGTLLLLAICLAPSLLRPRVHGELEARVLPVGQGDAVLVTPRGGGSYLVDTGPGGLDRSRGRRALAPALRWLGVRRLAGVFLTHGDEDHVGGLSGLLAAGIRVDTLYLSGTAGTRLRLPRARVPPSRTLLAPWTRRDRALAIDLLSPRADGPTAAGNEGSLVLKLAAPGGRLVLPGDLGGRAEDRLAARPDLGAADALLAGHHGSAGSTGEAWLDRLRPRIALVSCGARNRHGHPAPATLARLRVRGIEVHRTDREGILSLTWRDGRLALAAGGCRRGKPVL